MGERVSVEEEENAGHRGGESERERSEIDSIPFYLKRFGLDLVRASDPISPIASQSWFEKADSVWNPLHVSYSNSFKSSRPNK